MCEEGRWRVVGLDGGGLREYTFRHLTTIHTAEPRWARPRQARSQEATDSLSHWERDLQPQ